VTLVLARSDADAEHFAGLGVSEDRILVTGNIKYDLEADARSLEWADDIRLAAGQRPVVVAGSTMEGEEAQVLDAIFGLGSDGEPPFLILAPRHPERFDAVAKEIEDRGLTFARELARAYGLADLAFIGGSLAPTGGHNPLEPAVWGVPVLSGPHVHNFREVYDEMTAAGGARLVDDVAELRVAAAVWLDDDKFARAAGAAGRDVVESNRGASERTVSALLGLIGGA